MNYSADWMRGQSELWRTWQAAMSGMGTQPSPSFDPSAAFSSFFKPWLAGQQAPYSQADLGAWITQALAALGKFAGQGAGVGIGPDGENSSASPFASLFSFLRAPLNFDGSNFAASGAVGDAAQWGNFKPSDFFKLFDLPPLGITREWEIKWRDLQRALKTETEANAALGRLNTEIYTTALRQFLRALNERSAGDGDITSLRELYDFWIETAEAAYHAKLMTEEYAKTFGRFVNAGAARQKALNTWLDAWRELLNAPQRKELDDIIETQHGLAASLRELKQPEHSAPVVAALSERLDALAEELEQLRRAKEIPDVVSNPAPAPVPVPVPINVSASPKPARRRKAAQSADATQAKRKPNTDRVKRGKPAKAKRGSKAADEFDIGHFN